MSTPEQSDPQPADDTISDQLDDTRLDDVAGGGAGAVGNYGFPSGTG